MKPSSYATIATQYTRAVVAGKITTCKWVKQACQRQLHDLAKFKGMLYADEAIDLFAFDIRTYSWVQTKFRSRGILGRCLAWDWSMGAIRGG
jgi:phage terminase large subunit-like protein